jgi:endoglycosylceramidase
VLVRLPDGTGILARGRLDLVPSERPRVSADGSHRVHGSGRRPSLAPVLLALALAALVPAVGPAAADSRAARAAPPAGPLGHSGRFLTDSVGQVVILHGLNMVSKVAPYEPQAAGFGRAAARSLAADGFDVVRLGVLYSAVEPEPGVFSAAYVASIKRTVAVLASQGVYSLVDFHQDQLATGFGGEGFPAWSVETDGLAVTPFPFPSGYTSSAALAAAFDNLWTDQPGRGGVGLQERYAAAWRYVAARFAGDPWVLGYDLFNEPWPASGTDAELGAFYAKVIAAIRTVDRRHLVFYEPFVLFNFGQQTTLPHFSDPDLGMSFHDYCPADAATEPTECAADEARPVANALARAAATGDALVETEFGATDDLADLARVEGIADAHGISWIEWAYCGCDDPTGSVPPSIEGLVADPARPAAGANVDAAKLAVLSEPYPRLTAGTPRRYSFDHATRAMRYTYSVTSPAGRRFGPGSCTAIVVPRAQYPTGYSVEATGARVTSGPDAGVLTLAERTGEPSTVSVEIHPASSGHTALGGAVALDSCH